ncbi:hypothetical protein [Pseudonocardia asaccharolytica]|uniref:hypothetical protein n=1 Tax=Pseudonocardia asaccharolytica TaxID=54010 RepID=UPI0004292529|nr:hypothetical protein [Pseudonocardia asaccharolytica]
MSHRLRIGLAGCQAGLEPLPLPEAMAFLESAETRGLDGVWVNEEIASLCEFAPGRVAVGVAPHRPGPYTDAFGAPGERIRKDLAAHLDLVRRLLRGEVVDIDAAPRDCRGRHAPGPALHPGAGRRAAGTQAGRRRNCSARRRSNSTSGGWAPYRSRACAQRPGCSSMS